MDALTPMPHTPERKDEQGVMPGFGNREAANMKLHIGNERFSKDGVKNCSNFPRECEKWGLMHPPCLVLTGFARSGKTSAGKRTAQRLRVPFLDTDLLVQERDPQRRCCAEIVRAEGEKRLRLIESQIIATLRPPSGAVIALGGGVLLNADNYAYVRHWGLILYLELEKTALRERLLTPPLPTFVEHTDPAAAFENHYASRKYHYLHVADQRIVVDGHTVEEVTKTLIKEYRSWLVTPLASCFESRHGESLMDTL